MGLDVRRLIKRIPEGRLQAYLAERLTRALDWSQPGDARAAAIIGALDELPSAKRSDIYSDLERVAQFDADTGRRCLRAVVSNDDLAVFDALEGVEVCALWLLENDADAFDRAIEVNYATRLRNGRDWSPLELPGSGRLEVVNTETTLAAFQSRLEDIFRADGANDRRVKVEPFSIRLQDPLTGSPVEQLQFTIYVEEPAEAVPVFGSSLEIVRTTIRRLAEAALVLDATGRSLDVVAKARSQVRQQIAHAFLATMISNGSELVTRPRRRLRLDRLKRRLALSIEPADKVRSASVESLWLAAPDGDGGLVMIERPTAVKGRSEDLYSCASRWFGGSGYPDRLGWRVIAAKIRVVFEPEGRGKRPKAVAVELKAPDRSNLRDQTRHHRMIADTLLARWGLYEDAP